MNPFDPKSLDELPDTLPVFPLADAAMLPGTALPLNIFEPRYLNMILDAFAADRLIGMLQPDPRFAGESPVQTFNVGCAGRITAFNETDDGRLLISLQGVCRFRVSRELELRHGYRQVIAQWSEFAADLTRDKEFELSRNSFKQAFQAFFAANRIRIDWPALEKKEDHYLVDFLSMNLPFSSEEKQALLEARDTELRCQALLAIVGMAVVDSNSGTTRH